MAPSGAYVPSRALLRALSRPLPQRCPLLRRPAFTPPIRAKRTRAAKAEKLVGGVVNPNEAAQVLESSERRLKEDLDSDRAMRPLSDRALESDDLPAINWYEQDLDKGTPKRLIERLATAEDRKKEKEMYHMIEESVKNPDYDDALLNRRLIDSLLSNPNFADLTQELKEIKGGIKTKQELEALDKKAARDAEKDSKQLSASLKMATHQALQELINDPEAADAKIELQDVLDRMPEIEDIDQPEFQAILDKAMAKLSDSPAFQRKMAAVADKDTDADFEKEWEDYEHEVKDAVNETEAADDDLGPKTIEEIGDVDTLLTQMRDVLKSLGGDSKLEAELDAVLSEDPNTEQEGDFEREMDPEELAEELKKLAQSKASQKEIDAEEDVPAELQAKVDKIMEDPKLMEKLVYIQQVIEESERAKSDITAIAHEVAPDPYSELEDARTTTLRQRMQAARKDPAHIAAMDALRVNLLPPFNISPALKSFNQAIELAYIGANDDIRRILWRSYQKARTLPTFLQNLSDDAWDILYYSQAVTWGSNQNRKDHLRLLLADLRSLGRDGPPTHPSSLVKSGDGQHLEA
ncbi:hypothetical protein FB567DRAFT_149240 [Paraphoma chrysanthemicola]|uniref:Uncharacterized protein n=1 Tax=Paraphoma chrysanthemicola TaxID=798071 RepID=A0A8K0R017_9PLEO|nr:hypothetical protein FB567DRAFT_149240 [Paraphoma chrysanthemicola]